MLCGPQQPLCTLTVFLTFSLSLWLCFTHPSLTESSLRAGTISVSCLHSPWGTAECFSFLRSSRNVCRMNEGITKIEKLLQISLSGLLPPCKICQLQNWQVLLCFKCLKRNPIKNKVSSSVSFLTLSLHIGLLIRMLTSHPHCLLVFISPS